MYVILLDLYNHLHTFFIPQLTEFMIILCFMPIGTLFQYNKWKKAVKIKLSGTCVQCNFSIPTDKYSFLICTGW